MSDFTEVVHHWKRLCNSKAPNHRCIDVCPLGTNPVCGELEEAINADILEAQRIIMTWAKEHPEPMYPTWYEWLREVGVIVPVVVDGSLDGDEFRFKDRIPADIAQKLGIKAIEKA